MTHWTKADGLVQHPALQHELRRPLNLLLCPRDSPATRRAARHILRKRRERQPWFAYAALWRPPPVILHSPPAPHSLPPTRLMGGEAPPTPLPCPPSGLAKSPTDEKSFGARICSVNPSTSIYRAPAARTRTCSEPAHRMEPWQQARAVQRTQTPTLRTSPIQRLHPACRASTPDLVFTDTSVTLCA